MLNRSRLTTVASACAVVFALVAAVILIPVRADDRVRLGADILAGSRGSNPSNGAYDEPCFQINSIQTCPTQSGNCTTCTGANIIVPILGPQGQNNGQNSGSPSIKCGDKYNGTCKIKNGDYTCVTGGEKLGTCSTPNPPVKQ